MAWYDKWAIMVIAAVIGVAGYNGIPWCKIGVAEWAYWFGAIGTVGAWIGTIWIATSERRDRSRREIDAAIVISAAVIMKIVEIEVILMHIGMRFQSLSKSEGPSLIYWAKKLDQIPKINFDEIAALTVLPGGVATKLATANAEIDWCKRHTNIVSTDVAGIIEDDTMHMCVSIGERLAMTGNRLQRYKIYISAFIDKHGHGVI